MKYVLLTSLLISAMTVSAQLKYVGTSLDKGRSAAVIVDASPLMHTAQIFPYNKEGELVGKGDLKAQFKHVFSNITTVLRSGESDLDHLVKLNIHVSDEKSIPEIDKLLIEKFKEKHKPAVTYFTQLLWNGAAIAIDLVATSKKPMPQVQYISQNNKNIAGILPKGGATYISGQAVKGNLQEGTSGTLKQLESSLKHLGMTLKDVVQIKAYINKTAEITTVEKELAALFPIGAVPPIVYVEWVSKEYEIEIELIAASPTSFKTDMPPITFHDLPGMVHSPLYSKAVTIGKGKVVYLSGLYGQTGSNAQVQTEEIFASLDKLLQTTGSDFTHLVKATYLHKDTTGSAALSAVRPKYYDPHRAPGATKAQLNIMPAGKHVIVDMIALVR